MKINKKPFYIMSLFLSLSFPAFGEDPQSLSDPILKLSDEAPKTHEAAKNAEEAGDTEKAKKLYQEAATKHTTVGNAMDQKAATTPNPKAKKELEFAAGFHHSQAKAAKTGYQTLQNSEDAPAAHQKAKDAEAKGNLGDAKKLYQEATIKHGQVAESMQARANSTLDPKTKKEIQYVADVHKSEAKEAATGLKRVAQKNTRYTFGH